VANRGTYLGFIEKITRPSSTLDGYTNASTQAAIGKAADR